MIDQYDGKPFKVCEGNRPYVMVLPSQCDDVLEALKEHRISATISSSGIGVPDKGEIQIFEFAGERTAEEIAKILQEA
ncbi:hypothetical protein [Neorhodopirellula lusitana]|uniref:hypothetical protein n=1 Tax=Neorhodopirellula lusitana TaxID=445327 RepID=UPI0038507F30